MAIQRFTGRVQQRFSTLAAITATNPILLEGEVWTEKDASTGRSTGRRKVGDGVIGAGDVITGTAFNSLPFDPTAGGGDVVGPASATDGRAALFDGTTGKLLRQSSAAPVLEGDSRLSDARTPTAHAASHGSGGSDAITVAQGQVTGLGTALAGKETAGAVAAHEAAADPHPGYLTQAEGDGRYRQTATALTDGDIPAGIARDSEVAAAITAHEGAADPHPGYLTAAEGNAAYATAEQGALAATAVQPAVLTSGLAGKADLVGGVVPTSQIPAIALVQYLGSVATQSAMLALRGQGGDWCIRTDTATEWVIVANDGASLADWIQLPTGIAPVSSINGQIGAVTLGTGDLAESGGNLFFTGARAIGAALTGFTAAAGTVAATDSILAAFQKVVGNIAQLSVTGGGDWDTLIGTEISVTGTATATLGRMHVCSGTSADYTVTLPTAASQSGKVIGFRMSSALTRFVTIDGNASETIDGALTRVMWANEVAILRSDGSNWHKIAGKSIPLSAHISRRSADGAVSIAHATSTTVPLVRSVLDNSGRMLDLANSAIICRRSGNYLFSGTLTYGPMPNGNGSNIQFLAVANGTAVTPVCIFPAATNGSFPSLIGNVINTLSATDSVVMRTYQAGTNASAPLYLDASDTTCYLRLTEYAPW